jgi:glutathione synthase/RimK-type ligase-like ATP-grasp enzyme
MTRPLDLILLTDGRHESSEPPADAPATGSGSVAWTRQLLSEDLRLLEACRRAGLATERLSWSNPRFDWRSTRAACFRSTWDYSRRFGEFSGWLERASAGTRLLNDVAIVRWNVDKRYLGDLARAGIAIVPTEVVPRGSALDLGRRLAEADLIVKPAVSGAARETYRVSAANAAAVAPRLAALLQEEALLVQPFRHEILHAGERSLIVIAGRFSHAVAKRPKDGDFRVQDDHGGTVTPHVATPAEIDFALRAVAAAPSPPLYARVDFIEHAGRFELMELELIEPELFFRFRPAAADELATAVAEALARD